MLLGQNGINMSSEKQKMLSGQAYFSNDKTLQCEREFAKSVCQKFNQSVIENRKVGRATLKALFGASKAFWIEPQFYCDYGYNIFLGANFYANHGVTILDCAKVSIGDNVMLAPGVLISTAAHPTDVKERVKGLETAKPIVIGNNVWIGMGAMILEGVSIGDNAVVAAGAVVNRDVLPNTLVGGVPAKFIKSV
jgi:maltose O-acetyltransferase